jgi:hypothetical protein
MAARNLKVEENELSLFIPESSHPSHVRRGHLTAAKAGPCSNRKKTSYFGTEPKWKQTNDNRMHLLTTKEKAAESGLQFLNNASSILEEHKDGSLSTISNMWTESIGVFAISMIPCFVAKHLHRNDKTRR